VNVNDNSYLNGLRKPVIDATFTWGTTTADFCTGTLINRATLPDQLGYYFVTADHCVLDYSGEFPLPNDPEIDFNQFYTLKFNYQSPGAATSLTPETNQGYFNDENTSQSIPPQIPNGYEYYHKTKLRLVKRSYWGDFALIEILTPIPPHFNVSYAGWTPSPFYNGPLTEIQLLPPIPAPYVGISHPLGDIKKIWGSNNIQWLENPTAQGCYTVTTVIDVLFGWLWGNSVSSQVICNYVDNPWLTVPVLNYGATDRGSSGSGIFNSTNQLFGVLSGVGGSCDFPAFPMYGKLRANYYNASVKNTMNPTNNLAIDILGMPPIKNICYDHLILPGTQGDNVAAGQYFPASHYQDANKIVLQSLTSIEVVQPIKIYEGAEYKFRALSIVLNNNIIVQSGASFVAEIGPCGASWKTSPEEEMENLLLAKLSQINLPDKLIFEPGKWNVESEKIKIYPNPNNGTFTIQISSSEAKDITVQNLLGNIVYKSHNNTANNIEIDLRNYAIGVYVVKVITASGNIYAEKVVYN